MTEPTIADFMGASASAIRGSESSGDFVRGSDYEALTGPAAIVWSRQSARDTDLFNAVNFNTAEGDDLTNLAMKRFGKQRVLDSRGTGFVAFSRPAVGGDVLTTEAGDVLTTEAGDPLTTETGSTASIIHAGTRFLIQNVMYRATADASSITTTITVPIEAVKVGPGSFISGNPPVTIIDTISDVGVWTAQSVQCSDGTLLEPAPDFRARIRRERTAERVGQTDSIEATCISAGAGQVVLFRSDFAGNDYDAGLNVCYVGTSGYTSSPSLVRACALALRKTRVGGDHLQVLQTASVVLNITANVYLNNSPSFFNLPRLNLTHVSSIESYFASDSGQFAYTLDGIRGALIKPTPEVQRVVFITPTVDESITFGPRKSFPAVLNRYTPGVITLNYM